MEVRPSLIKDYATKKNHTMDWEGVKFPTRDNDWIARGVIEEAVKIRKPGAHAKNRDWGNTNYIHYTPSCW